MNFRLKFVPGSVTFQCFPEPQNGKSPGLDGKGGGGGAYLQLTSALRINIEGNSVKLYHKLVFWKKFVKSSMDACWSGSSHLALDRRSLKRSHHSCGDLFAES